MFGAASSPTCANYALQRVGIDNKDQSPIAAKAIENNFYMDDFIKSFQMVEEWKQIFHQLQPLLSKHGFELKKWISNGESINELIPEDLRSISAVKKIEIDPTAEDPSVLGLQWSIDDDTLQVCRGTKRKFFNKLPNAKFCLKFRLCSTLLDCSPLSLLKWGECSKQSGANLDHNGMKPLS